MHKTELGFKVKIQIYKDSSTYTFYGITGFNRLGEEVIAPDYADIHIVSDKRFGQIAKEISEAINKK